MIFKTIILLSAIAVSVYGAFTLPACMHPDFARKHICKDCTKDQALAKGMQNQQERRANVETIFILPNRDVLWTTRDGEPEKCAADELLDCYNFKKRKDQPGVFDCEKGSGTGIHSVTKNGHYIGDVGICTPTGARC